jgi:hypothetical protein
MALLAGSAHAKTRGHLVEVAGPEWAQAAVHNMRVPVVPNQAVILAACPGYEQTTVACNFATKNSPIYIDPSDMGDVPMLYREFGGRFDTLAMYPWARRHFMAILRYHGPWYNDESIGEVEVFEDAYADCAMGLEPRHTDIVGSPWVDTLGYEPSVRQHKRVCGLITRVGLRAGFSIPRVTSGEPSSL